MCKLQISKIVLIITITLALTANGIKLNPVKATSSTWKVPEDYPTIQAAINTATPGDTIMVANGTYNENLFVDKSVSIIGENPATTIIDGGRNGYVIHVVSSNVIISGLTVQNGKEEFPYSGIYLYNCASALIYNNILKNNYCGLELKKSNGSRIFSNVIVNNAYAGVYVHEGSSDNIFFENTVTNNCVGVWGDGSPLNTFYHNNFVENTNQTRPLPPMIFDNGVEGNFWSDYNGVDGNLDGIGDLEYVNAGDNYPLMGKFTNHTFQYDSQTFFLAIISNSTISDFQFDKLNQKIEFYVSGPNGTVGFCRLTAPTTIIQNRYVILMDYDSHPFIKNWTDGTYIFGYTTYVHTGISQKMTVSLTITPKNELPFYLILTVTVTALAVVGILVIIFSFYKRRKGIKRKG